ncbi:hypothetical protein NEPAR06_0515 [Nematocida parisii]|uniref:Uncharacterized protein n=1 Tax=Nematocida parisii (strain ERTm3) TaxID=935791 RepID=I3EJD8_NEMP3|nr:uncharacterized protein NEPG_01132 [Nematocida parisii ERTm1]EIJ89335.1 hypothetical protein NEQG_00105 [Nematocida parisii ERTm3]KAI5142567.1 hypothetical protein NEPAR07_0172 [Nematocida parisii]EIJ94464.1 hypothetical protein NEPG_01132 [Nematocida parisii ERTm1]KAI5153515.1 hypothetical protein NEPAR06_0515 [Nematocida parisii]KAI5156938.1 hypothetical protein NEPAR05_0921 [Nematocida parisii]|eukprot:XP_013058960.1 hypothetical protein NEPG_01132 [Nematocida parisii ERTm1]
MNSDQNSKGEAIKTSTEEVKPTETSTEKQITTKDILLDGYNTINKTTAVTAHEEYINSSLTEQQQAEQLDPSYKQQPLKEESDMSATKDITVDEAIPDEIIDWLYGEVDQAATDKDELYFSSEHADQSTIINVLEHNTVIPTSVADQIITRTEGSATDEEYDNAEVPEFFRHGLENLINAPELFTQEEEVSKTFKTISIILLIIFIIIGTIILLNPNNIVHN